MPIDQKWIESAVIAVRALERMYTVAAPAGVDTKLSIEWTKENPFVSAWYGDTGIAVPLLRTKDAKEAALALRAALADPATPPAPSSRGPGVRWHADGNGKCHEACEQYRGSPRFVSCGIVEALPWQGLMSNEVRTGSACPFALLADVLRAAQPHEEKPAEKRMCTNCGDATCKGAGKLESDASAEDCWRPLSDQTKPTEDLEHMMHLAWGCGYHYGRGLPNDDHSEDIDRMNADVHLLVVHERSEVASTSAIEDRRCGTCSLASTILADEYGRAKCDACGVHQRADGPPWPNCRFWRKR